MSSDSAKSSKSGPTTRQLLLMRHAKAAYPPGVVDHERPLAGRGRKDAPDVGRWLVEQNLVPDVVICSDAARTMETAQLVVSGTGQKVPVRPEHILYESHVGGVFEAVRAVGKDVGRVLVVGHEPTMSATIASLTGQFVRCPTAAIAVVDLTVAWSKVDDETGSLRTLRIPKDS